MSPLHTSFVIAAAVTMPLTTQGFGPSSTPFNSSPICRLSLHFKKSRFVVKEHHRRTISFHDSSLRASNKKLSGATNADIDTNIETDTDSRSNSNSNSKYTPSSTDPSSRRSWTGSVTTITGKWREMFECLQSFQAQHGHTRVPYNYPANPELGRWVTRQRNLYKKYLDDQDSSSSSSSSGTRKFTRLATVLTPERISALQSINFSFTSPRSHTWSKRYNELCTFRAEHGHCLVPLHYEANTALGFWVRNQRTQYRNLLAGKKSYLNSEKISALMSIGFVWDTQRDELWKKRFDELMDFKKVYGHCMVPERYHENPNLGMWVVNQRTSYKNFLAGNGAGSQTSVGANSDGNTNGWKRNGGKSLTREKIASLESIGFSWAQPTFNWYAMYERLKIYKEERKQLLNGEECEEGLEGSESENNSDYFFVPPDSVENRDLRRWIAVQRREYSYLKKKNHRSSMTPRRQRALEEIGFTWTARSGNSSSGNTVGPTVEDWSKLFQQMREKGVDPGMKPKEHWFEGQSERRVEEINKEWTEEDLLELWNREGDENDDGW